MKWLKCLGNQIKRKSIITYFSENGPQFHLVHCIFVIDNDFQIVTCYLHDCFFVQHLQAYTIFDVNNYSYCVLNLKKIKSSVILTCRNLLADGYYYVAKSGFKCNNCNFINVGKVDNVYDVEEKYFSL